MSVCVKPNWLRCYTKWNESPFYNMQILKMTWTKARIVFPNASIDALIQSRIHASNIWINWQSPNKNQPNYLSVILLSLLFPIFFSFDLLVWIKWLIYLGLNGMDNTTWIRVPISPDFHANHTNLQCHFVHWLLS